MGQNTKNYFSDAASVLEHCCDPANGRHPVCWSDYATMASQCCGRRVNDVVLGLTAEVAPREGVCEAELRANAKTLAEKVERLYERADVQSRIKGWWNYQNTMAVLEDTDTLLQQCCLSKDAGALLIHSGTG